MGTWGIARGKVWRAIEQTYVLSLIRHSLKLTSGVELNFALLVYHWVKMNVKRDAAVIKYAES